MNLIGQWNKDKTRCWRIGTDIYAWLMGGPKMRYRAECWSSGTTGQARNNFTLTQTMPWRDTMEEAQRDIPKDE